MKLKYFKIIMLMAMVLSLGSCRKFFNINQDPDRLPSSFKLYPQLLTAAQVNLGFEAGSDLYRYATLFMQQMSGNASQPNQTYEYYRYNVTGSDLNNTWGSIFAGTLSDLELVISQATADGSPHYAGVAKILKAYEYSLVIDTWGDVPFTEAQQLDGNTQPAYDDDATIYPKLNQLLIDAIVDMNQAASTQSPGTNSVYYSNATFATARAFWIKLANTLRLRLFLHYSKKDPAFSLAQMTTLINAGGFMTSNADNFQMNWYNVANQRSPISAFEVSRPNYLYADQKMVGMMNTKADPRRPFYFTSFPYINSTTISFTLNTSEAAPTGDSLRFPAIPNVVPGLLVSGINIPANTSVISVNSSTNRIKMNNNVTGAGVANGDEIKFALPFVGVAAATPPPTASSNYSRIHTFLRGAVTAGTAPPFTYSGAAPGRMLSYTEYCFIRAEASLMGAPSAPLADAQAWFTAGITASMAEVGITGATLNTYIGANGTLAGTNAQKLQQIIEEKYVALFGVSTEPWTDWRRTGYPALTVPTNAITSVTAVPHYLFYPQSEIDLNPNNPGQKNANLTTTANRPFWDQ